MTPCEEKGYEFGDRFRVINGSTFSVGSIVELFRDEGSVSPLFRLLKGYCVGELADGEPGAFCHLRFVEKIEQEAEMLDMTKNQIVDPAVECWMRDDERACHDHG